MGTNVLNNQILAIVKSVLKNPSNPMTKEMSRKYGIDGEVVFTMKYVPVSTQDRRKQNMFEVTVTYLEQRRDEANRVLKAKFVNNKLTHFLFQIEPGRICEDRIRVTQLSRIVGHAFATEIKG